MLTAQLTLEPTWGNVAAIFGTMKVINPACSGATSVRSTIATRTAKTRLRGSSASRLLSASCRRPWFLLVFSAISSALQGRGRASKRTSVDPT
jgi:uncharacterized membrane protein